MSPQVGLDIFGDWMTSAESASSINVQSAPYNATGDGVTDDTIAIQNAIAACREGQIVFFPAADYMTSSPLHLFRNQTLQGTHTARWPYDGGNPSTIKSTASFIGTAMLLIQDMEQAGLAQEQDGIRIRNMSFDNNNVGSTIDCILTSGQVRDFAMTDVTLSQATGSGLHSIGYTRAGGYVHPKGFNLHRCVSWFCHNNGFSLNDTTDSILFDCLAVANFANGFFLTGAGECQYFSCRSVFNGASGFVYTGIHTGSVFVSCTTDRNDKNGFVMSATGAYSVVFFGFQARRDGKNGTPGAGGGGYAGLSVQGTIGTLASPVVINGMIQSTGVNDDGTGAVSPQYGISSTYCRFLSVKGNLWGVTASYNDGGGNTTVRFDPTNFYTTGPPTSPVRDSTTTKQNLEGALSTSPLLSTRITGDVSPKWEIDSSGKQTFNGDALLYRSQPRTLRTDTAWATGLSTQTLLSNGAVTIDASTGNTQLITLQANATSSSITNPSLGQVLTIQWKQDGSGGRTYVWPTSCLFTGSSTPSNVVTASGSDSATFFYNGTNWIELSRASAYSASGASVGSAVPKPSGIAVVGVSASSSHDDHAHPSTQLGANDHGFIAWNYPAYSAVNTQLLTTAGTLYLCRIPINYATTITNVVIHISTQGSGLTSGQNFAALYSSAGNLLSFTADQAAAWATVGAKIMALSAAQAVAIGYYYVGIFANGTTLPTLFRSVSGGVANSNLSAANSNWATCANGTGLTTAMPGTTGVLTAYTQAIWVAVS